MPIALPQAGRTQKLIRLDLPPLHPNQGPFFHDHARFVVAACGTKWGKTFSLSEWLLQFAWNRDQSTCWWVGPTYSQSSIAFDYIGRWLPPGRYKPHRGANLSYDILRSDGGIRSTIEFKSADNPASLRGEGVHAAVIDEAAYWKRQSFISVQTTLTRTAGKCRIISTPKGRNWFYDEWWKGCADNPKRDKDYSSYKLPTSSNPYVPRESIEYARRNMPADSFRQEYEAEFLTDGAGVFRNLETCQTAVLYRRPGSGRNYVIGIDWAKHNDFTVMVVGDVATREIVHIARYNDVDWNVNIDRAVKLARTWNNAQVLMDSTGVGDVPYDLMRAVYPQCYGYSIYNNAQKKALIQKLQVAFERNEISIPNPALQRDSLEFKTLAETMVDELRTYEYRVTPLGAMTFSSPEGFFDDCVVALALTNWMFAREPFVYKFSQVQNV